jgi:diphthamide synthase subunit DPH2
MEHWWVLVHYGHHHISWMISNNLKTKVFSSQHLKIDLTLIDNNSLQNFWDSSDGIWL